MLTSKTCIGVRDLFVAIAVVTGLLLPIASAEPLVIKRQGRTCNDDPFCFNRLHPAVPMRAQASSGQLLVLETRNSSDFELDPARQWDDPRRSDAPGSTIHPLTGPLHIDGARAGDSLRVEVIAVEPGAYGATVITETGLISDVITSPYFVSWALGEAYASSDSLPGVRIPKAAFPGILTTLPGAAQLNAILERERRARDEGRVVSMPSPVNALPAELCGPEGSSPDECLRTIPPREHGGNMDSRYLRAGSTVYLPCYIDGCGLAVGDAHYAQGDGELSGTAIEMDATVLLRAEIVPGMTLPRGPHYEGPASLLAIPSGKFYATTGLSVADPADGESGPRSDDLTRAARNALLAMIEHMVAEYGLTREQAYIVASVAVDLRISQLVNSPNLGVTAILPTDIFLPQPMRGVPDR